MIRPRVRYLLLGSVVGCFACSSSTPTPAEMSSSGSSNVAGGGTGMLPGGAGSATTLPGGAGTGTTPTGGAGSGNVGGTGSGTGGTAPGAAGSAGTSSGGQAGSTATGNCTFTPTATASTAIPTVGIVEWSTSLATVESAQIDFSLVSPTADETNRGGSAPVNLKNPKYRTLLLGLKGSRDYTYTISATGGGVTCKSQQFMFKTGAVPSSVPTVMHKVQNANARAKGFIITSGGLSGGFGGGGGGGGGGAATPAYILDSDGAVVWWAAAPSSCSRAHMNWEGTDMWMLELNVDNAGGEMRRVSMDGLDVQMNVDGLSTSHHDFTVLPGGIVATMLWSGSGRDPYSNLIERSPDGTIKTVRKLDATAYSSTTFHSNAIHYLAKEDVYTISDRNPNLFIKLKRSGDLLWQFGGSCTGAPAPKCATGNWQVNHGHHLLDNGHFLFFNNGQNSQSAAFEYTLTDSGSTLTATQVWKYQPSGVNSTVLGDIERLPNGNTLITYSTQGQIHEIDASQNLVQSFTTTAFGYADFRESLYGAPPR